MPSDDETYSECSRCGESGVRFGRNYCERCGEPVEIWSVLMSQIGKIEFLDRRLDNLRKQLKKETRETRAEISQMERSLEEFKAKAKMLEDKLGEGKATETTKV